ncbi:hypothetical protein phiA829_98 [Aeromonas phage phiA8-29]|uniref:Uncharacterized protein n=1 Tax=Aeromonas phage phiA8-29 TaxID=1978922 RepID=A0A1W6DYD7_9CAUD|nr:hypothetical protein HWB15_gp179 [Aeromonas phage phiA8-29]ARK07918.1 hypothetical protein phiA829_98 [Aeromonas phage phiA8-29]
MTSDQEEKEIWEMEDEDEPRPRGYVDQD